MADPNRKITRTGWLQKVSNKEIDGAKKFTPTDPQDLRYYAYSLG